MVVVDALDMSVDDKGASNELERNRCGADGAE